jgi:hypothetical protein
MCDKLKKITIVNNIINNVSNILYVSILFNDFIINKEKKRIINKEKINVFKK